MCKKYECDWCNNVSTSEEWTKATVDAMESEYDPEDCYPDGWSVDTADMGDTVVCPVCGNSDERSEIIEC